MDIFETENLCYVYKNGKSDSLKDVNIKIGKGRKTALLGANGAGKSTLFYHFNGVFKPRTGTVFFDGRPIDYSKDALKELRSDVSVMLQNPDEQIFSATVEEDVAFGMLNNGAGHEEVDARIDEVLSMVGMSEYRMRPTQQLSYGQRKRVAFAGAIATRPKVLIMDEPTAGLDPQMAQETMEIAEQLHVEGTDVIISTHDVDLAYAWADEIHVLRNGSLAYSGASEGFYADDVSASFSGLKQPAIFAANEHISEFRKIDSAPYPRTRAEFLSKTAPPGRRIGMLHGISVSSDTDLSADGLTQSEKSIRGIMGIETRAKAYAAGIRLDYVFNGLENCIVEVMNGNDATLFFDASLECFVKNKVERTASFGTNLIYSQTEGF